MAGKAGGTEPDPGDADSKPGETGKSRISEPSPLERLVAAHLEEKQAQRKRDSRVLALVLLVLVVFVGGGVFALVRVNPSWLHRASARPASSVRPTPTAAAVAPLSTDLANRPPADPFAGVPADQWADGAAGITVPGARAHGPYTAAQVRLAYETTRKLLIAGNLDWPTLRGGAPSAFTALLPRSERQQFLSGLHLTALNKDGSEQNTRTWVSSFAPGSASFVTTVIKVHGTMSASTASDSGTEVLRISFDYLFAYAVEPPGHPAEWTRIVQQRYGSVDFAQWDPGAPFEPWISVGTNSAGVLCGTRDGYLHPDYPQGPPASVQPSGPARDPYSLATTSPAPGSCEAVTRT
jgi:hypothetical protein